MDAVDRLMRLFQKHNVNFSIEGLSDGKIHVSISKDYGSFQDVAGGDYNTIEEGIHGCVNQLEDRARRRTIKKV